MAGMHFSGARLEHSDRSRSGATISRWSRPIYRGACAEGTIRSGSGPTVSGLRLSTTGRSEGDRRRSRRSKRPHDNAHMFKPKSSSISPRLRRKDSVPNRRSNWSNVRSAVELAARSGRKAQHDVVRFRGELAFYRRREECVLRLSGWVLGTISATGSSVRRDLRPRSNVLSDKSWQHDER